jgi:hypothetical protein
MSRVLITGTGLFNAPDSLTNAELVESPTTAVDSWNAAHAEASCVHSGRAIR